MRNFARNIWFDFFAYFVFHGELISSYIVWGLTLLISSLEFQSVFNAYWFEIILI